MFKIRGVTNSDTAMKPEMNKKMLLLGLVVLTVSISDIGAWTGEIHGRVICDVCADSALGPEDHILEGLFFPSLFPQLKNKNRKTPCNALFDFIIELGFWV